MPTYSAKFSNKKVANLGSVKITFDDGSHVTKNINSLGDYWFDQNSTRQAFQIEALGQSWLIADLASAGASGIQVNYPNSVIGKLTQETVQEPEGDLTVVDFMDTTE